MQGKAQEPQQIIVREVGPAPVVKPDVDPFVLIEQRAAALNRLLNIAVSATHGGQWVDQQGKPWPTGAAAEVMARRCAVSITDIKRERVDSRDDKGPYYLYVYECTASLPGGNDEIRAIGTCSSRDQFLGTETSQGRPLSEIDEGNIMKAAYTNMEVNAITRLLGVRNLTWEQLSALGIEKGSAARVNYHAGSKGGGTGKTATADPEIKWGSAKGKKVSELEEKDTRFYLGKAEENVSKNDEKWHKQNVAMRDALAAHLEKLTGGKAGEAAPGGEKKDSKRQHGIWKAISDLGLDPKGFIERTLGGAKSWKDWTPEDMDHLEESLKAEKVLAGEPGSGG